VECRASLSRRSRLSRFLRPSFSLPFFSSPLHRFFTCGVGAASCSLIVVLRFLLRWIFFIPGFSFENFRRSSLRLEWNKWCCCDCFFLVVIHQEQSSSWFFRVNTLLYIRCWSVSGVFAAELCSKGCCYCFVSIVPLPSGCVKKLLPTRSYSSCLKNLPMCSGFWALCIGIVFSTLDERVAEGNWEVNWRNNCLCLSPFALLYGPSIYRFQLLSTPLTLARRLIFPQSGGTWVLVSTITSEIWTVWNSQE